MKVKSARAAELSDYEVLQALRDMDKRQQALVVRSAKAASAAAAVAAAAAKERQAATSDGSSTATLSVAERTMQSLPPNLRTIQYEVLETLQNVQRPSAHQTSTQIPRFMDALSQWERGRPVEGVAQMTDNDVEHRPREIIDRDRRLTKGERLMLINHAPTTEIELYPLVEEIEERFSAEQRVDMLAIIAAHLPIDLDAMQAAQDRIDEAARQAAALNGGDDDDEEADDDEQTFVAQDEEMDDIADPAEEDMDMLMNEKAGGPGVEDEAPDE